ncbi:DUF262 domain-containing protein [Flavobacterium sp.]|uniref:DUF262 domain-containing protein n=1 Tax=Flavobacterium sp. TaxID=239 RepID=UPI003BD05B15
MNIEVHFTPLETNKEIPFTIATGRTETEIFLYSQVEEKEYKIPLTSENGLLRLVEANPFEETTEIVNERLVGLSTDWLETKSQGFENSTDFVLINKPGYGPDDIFVENKPFSLRQIVELINNGDILLTPDFQRNFIWDKTRQSKLIESILLGLPLPSIYLSQYKDGRLTVVDGLQRLHTIKYFLEDKLVLSNLEYLKECNGKTYSQLEGILSPLRYRKFGQTQIMCFVIDYRSPTQLKFDLFRRLNTGGKPLNNQEIRNCLSRPSVQQLLKNMVELENFGNATDWSVKDTRMEAREAALRFIYFFEQYTASNPVDKYNGDMETTLDDFIDDLNKRENDNLEKYISIYDKALGSAYHLFGDYCFRKVLPETVNGKRTPVNKLLMLTLSVLLTKFDSERTIELNEENSLLVPLAEFIENEERLFDAMTWGTNGKWNIEKGFTSLWKFLDENLIVA